MISRASVLALFGKNLINVSVKNAKMPSINGRYRFAEEKKKQSLGSYLTEAEINQKVDEKQLSELLEHVKELQGKELSRHNTTLSKVQKQLSGQQKSRIQKISQLINGLSQAQAEYFRYRVLKAVDA